MSHERFSLVEYRGPEGLKAVEADWRRLYDSMPITDLWHSYEAYSVYIDTLCPSPEHFVCLTLSDGECVRAILPLEERNEPGLGAPMRVWGVPWSGAWRPTDAIGPEDDARRALLPAAVEYLRRKPGRPAILVLGQTRDESVLWEGLDAVPASTWFAFPDGGEFVVPTDMPFDALEEHLSRKSRQRLRKAARSFEELPDASYVRAVSLEELDSEYPHFLDVEASGWKGERGSAIKQHPELVAFYRGLIERMRLDGHCELHSLHAEGRCIASNFCVFTRGESVGIKGGYDESYAWLMPGKLATHKDLEWCCGDPEVDAMSMAGNAPWLRSWHPSENGLRRAYVSLRPISGGLALAALRFRYGPLRRLVRAVNGWRASRESASTDRRGRDAG